MLKAAIRALYHSDPRKAETYMQAFGERLIALASSMELAARECMGDPRKPPELRVALGPLEAPGSRAVSSAKPPTSTSLPASS